jgi:hypothetical protein
MTPRKKKDEGAEKEVPSSEETPVETPQAAEPAPESAPEEAPASADLPAPEPVAEKPAAPTVFELAERDLVALEAQLVELLGKVKEESKMETVEQVRLGAVHFLREAKSVLEQNAKLVAEMSGVLDKVNKEARGLQDARDYINAKSNAFRTERDAFVVLKGISEKEYFLLLESVRQKAA